MEYNAKEKSVIWLDSFLDLEYKVKDELLKNVKNIEDIYNNIENYREYIVSNTNENLYNLMLRSANENYLNYIFTALEKRGLTMITRYSKQYPDELKEIPTPPIVLYCKGNIELLNENKKIGIVGSRKTLPQILAKTEEVSRELSANGLIIVTGMAQGADTSAIQGSIEEGKVISIIASGIDDIYPEQSRPMLDKLVENGGLVLGEYNPGIKAKGYLFPIRNRIIAGLVKGVLVVSGGLKSGTNYTANYAGEFGRDVFAFPYGIGIESGEGCNELIKNGAILTTSARDILESYGIEQREKEDTQGDINEEERKILEIIKQGDIHIEKIAQILNKEVFELMPTLLMLEIKGKVIKDSGNIYSSL